MKITLGPKKVKLTSVMEMVEEFETDGGEPLLKEGWLALPLNDYIKEKHKVNPVETTERLEKDLNFRYKDLISKGFPEKEVKPAINQNKKSDKNQENSTVDPTEEAMSVLKESYQRYQTFEAEKAEIKVKELLESLNLPSLVI